MRFSPGSTILEPMKPRRVHVTNPYQGERQLTPATIIDLSDSPRLNGSGQGAYEDQPYRSVPLYFGDHHQQESAAQIYRLLLEGRASRVVAAIRAVAEAGGNVKILSSTDGAHDAKLIGAVILESLGLPRQDILAWFEPATHWWKPQILRNINRRYTAHIELDHPALTSELKFNDEAPTQALNDVLDWLQASYGSIKNYLLSNGLSKAEYNKVLCLPAAGLSLGKANSHV